MPLVRKSLEMEFYDTCRAKHENIREDLAVSFTVIRASILWGFLAGNSIIILSIDAFWHVQDAIISDHADPVTFIHLTIMQPMTNR